jgi:VanZ family protein
VAIRVPQPKPDQHSPEGWQEITIEGGGSAAGATDMSHLHPFLRLLRPIAWGCVGLIAVLSLLPSEEMVRTRMGGHIEHAVAYAGTAVLLRLGYPAWGKQIAVGLVLYAGLLELLQNFSPGRHSEVSDWLASSTGALMGIAVIHVSYQVWWRLRLSGRA